ncbi:hypothetical protein STRIP9103_00085, partial [Streptomyces ipomoeae 91-03]
MGLPLTSAATVSGVSSRNAS